MTKHKHLFLAALLLCAFVVWTLCAQSVDLAAVGPQGSVVGFSKINQFVHSLTGVCMPLYTVTDWLGLVPVAFGLGFALLGLGQWIRRKDIIKVDFDLLALGGFYVVVAAVYLFFEAYAVNYRPVRIGGFLEASYPSSTTLLVLCVMPTAIGQLRRRIKHQTLKKIITAILWTFTIFMVVGRLLSGVHWLSDIVGGILLSGGLVRLYAWVTQNKKP